MKRVRINMYNTLAREAEVVSHGHVEVDDDYPEGRGAAHQIALEKLAEFKPGYALWVTFLGSGKMYRFTANDMGVSR